VWPPARTGAREAAEAAVASPLLEDIDLSGARGILVNVTAGMDMAIGEFDEVGQTVKEFASEDATVVVGAVIDPEMSNEMRVTVVATGLGPHNIHASWRLWCHTSGVFCRRSPCRGLRKDLARHSFTQTRWTRGR
jgi:cell division GTPase FtsZ